MSFKGIIQSHQRLLKKENWPLFIDSEVYRGRVITKSSVSSKAHVK
jgi:hypothetical protein